MAAKIEPILTIADLDAMPEDGNRYELIEGNSLYLVRPIYFTRESFGT